MKPAVNVAITGAAGQIGYALAFRVASGQMLGADTPVVLLQQLQSRAARVPSRTPCGRCTPPPGLPAIEFDEDVRAHQPDKPGLLAPLLQAAERVQRKTGAELHFDIRHPDAWMARDFFGIFEAFVEANLDDDEAVRTMGRKFRDTILASGGSVLGVTTADVHSNFCANNLDLGEGQLQHLFLHSLRYDNDAVGVAVGPGGFVVRLEVVVRDGPRLGHALAVRVVLHEPARILAQLQLAVQESRVQQIADAQQYLAYLERLRDEVHRSRAERLIIVLYYFEEMTMKEIGATLDLSESRVSQMHSSICCTPRHQFPFPTSTLGRRSTTATCTARCSADWRCQLRPSTTPMHPDPRSTSTPTRSGSGSGSDGRATTGADV